ncbi:MAG: hypothetical protein H7X77_05115 [Anaerolineae bacterium]|nr:hypothetical protein [Anaerolineae bacterium]
MAEALTTSERALMDALGFTAEDLQANRGGQLSAAQRQKLAQRTLFMAGVALVAGIVFLLSYNSLPDAGGAAPSPLVTFGLLPISLAVLAFALFELFGAFMKLQRNSISTARGNAEIEIDASARRLFGKLTVGKFTMFVPKTQLVAFHPGEPYAIYYTSYPKQIVSAEFMAGNP